MIAPVEEKFIYVFSDEDRDKLIAAGFRMMRHDDKQHIYTFENREDLHFALKNMAYMPSNTLTF